MPVDIRIEGAEKFAALSKALGKGSKELRSELNKGITRAVKPFKADVKKFARGRLPKRGGLARRVARTSLPTRKRTDGIRVVAQPNAVADPMRIDRGRVKHPVFGRAPSVLQDITPGFFHEPAEDSGPVVRKELVEVIDTVTSKIERTL